MGRYERRTITATASVAKCELTVPTNSWIDCIVTAHTPVCTRYAPRLSLRLAPLTPVYVGPAVAEEFKRIVRDSEITK